MWDAIKVIPQINDVNSNYAYLKKCLLKLNVAFKISDDVMARNFVLQALEIALCLMINESLLPKLETINRWLDNGDGEPPFELVDQATKMIPIFSYNKRWGYKQLCAYLKKVEANLLESKYNKARKNMWCAINTIKDITQKVVECKKKEDAEDAKKAAAEAEAAKKAAAEAEAAEKAAAKAEAATWTIVKKKRR